MSLVGTPTRCGPRSGSADALKHTHTENYMSCTAVDSIGRRRECTFLLLLTITITITILAPHTPCAQHSRLVPVRRLTASRYHLPLVPCTHSRAHIATTPSSTAVAKASGRRRGRQRQLRHRRRGYLPVLPRVASNRPALGASVHPACATRPPPRAPRPSPAPQDARQTPPCVIAS